MGLSNLLASLNRMRHTRGFGIHSPFAYTVVRDVVAPSDSIGYYGYHDIDRSLGPSSRRAGMRDVRRLARLLLRLTVFLRARHVFIPADAHPALKVAAEAAGARVETRPSHADECGLILLTRSAAIKKGVLAGYISRPGNAILADDPDIFLWMEVAASLREGLILHSPNRDLIISREGMARMIYSVNI